MGFKLVASSLVLPRRRTHVVNTRGRRVLLTIPILLGVTIICFALVKIAPGDPVQNLLSPTASAADAARLRAAYGPR